MARIDDLIARITDPALRREIEASVADLKKRKQFGLVFEEHVPETTALLGLPVQVGSIVQQRKDSSAKTYRVIAITPEGEASIEPIDGGDSLSMLAADLMVVKRFGEPIYPGLTSLGSVRRGPDDKPAHAVISGENYHALQLLLYLYEGQIDCIYIDPPYNTGALTWKYNNRYVDNNDAYRHSKWLAFMKRRLLLAMRLLKRTGIMCITIDDYEVHHLKCLLEEQIPQAEILGTIVIKNNPAGRSTVKGFAVAHEYALFVAKSDDVKIGRLARTPEQQARYREQDEQGWFEWVNFRKHGGADANRAARRMMYYPIYAAGTQIRIPHMEWNEVTREWIILEPPAEGETVILPLNDRNDEKRWKWAHTTVLENLSSFTVRPDRTGRSGVYVKSRPPDEGTLPLTWWDKALYSATDYGTNLLSQIMDTSNTFPFPKSKYAVMDCLISAGIGSNKSALVLDFFAGSGTTLEAVLDLNAADSGNRRCVLVTNNEVSPIEAATLLKEGLAPGDPAFEAQGIAQSVTFPRVKYVMNGRRDDDTQLTGDVPTGRIIPREQRRRYHQIKFINSMLAPRNWKRELVKLIETVPQSRIGVTTRFFVEDNITRSVLFEEAESDQYLEALEGQEHITDFYLVTQNNALFRELTSDIDEVLGPLVLPVEEKRALREGFPENAEFFRLDYLDQDDVDLGMCLNSILPALWLSAGGVGRWEDVPPDADFSIPANSTYGVLLKPSRFGQFRQALEERPEVTHVWLMTDSDEAFAEMRSQLPLHLQVSMLYRDYLRAFRTNSERRQ